MFIPKYIVILVVTIIIDYVAEIWLEKPGFSIGESALLSGQAGNAGKATE